jgi:hypothetical protein
MPQPPTRSASGLLRSLSGPRRELSRRSVDPLDEAMIVCAGSAAEVLAWPDAAGFAVEDLRLLGAIAARWRAPLDYLHVFALE